MKNKITKKEQLETALRSLRKILDAQGYKDVHFFTTDGDERLAITSSLKIIIVRRVGSKSDGYWIDTATGMPVVPVWFK